MSHPHGAYLGGIATLEDLRLRCVVDEDTGCWHCRMGLKAGVPRVTVRLIEGGYIKMLARRAGLYLRDKKPLPKGHIAWGKLTCHSKDCANPAHSKSGTKAQWGADLAKSGKVKSLPTKIAAARATGRLRRKLTDEQISAVRQCELPAARAADMFGVSEFMVRSIRSTTRFQPTVNGASVFTWRPA